MLRTECFYGLSRELTNFSSPNVQDSVKQLCRRISKRLPHTRFRANFSPTRDGDPVYVNLGEIIAIDPNFYDVTDSSAAATKDLWYNKLHQVIGAEREKEPRSTTIQVYFYDQVSGIEYVSNHIYL